MKNEQVKWMRNELIVEHSLYNSIHTYDLCLCSTLLHQLPTNLRIHQLISHHR